MTGLEHIRDTFKPLADRRRAAFMPFLAAGDPDLAATSELILAMQRSGADLLELGVPYSDPLADGPIIQDSFTRALAKDIHVADVLDAVARARSAGATLPVLTMVSYSLVYRYGAERYVNDCLRVGVDGLIVPDLAVEESDLLRGLVERAGLALVFLVTPTTPRQRELRILESSTGFIYCVSVVGITGERDSLPETLTSQVRRLRSETSLPVCVGFGVSRPDQASRVGTLADGVIVGSALVRCISQAPPGQAVAYASQLAGSLARAVHEPQTPRES